MEAKNILIVDDDPHIVSMISAMLHKFRPHDWIVTALTCKDALIRLESNHFDMVICNFSLPDGKGETVLNYSHPLPFRVGISATIHQQDLNTFYDGILVTPFGLADIYSLFEKSEIDSSDFQLLRNLDG